MKNTIVRTLALMSLWLLCSTTLAQTHEPTAPTEQTETSSGSVASEHIIKEAPAEPQSPSSKPWFAGTTLEERKVARDIFLEGNRLIRIPHFAGAAAKYEEAISIWSHPAFHYNLAIAQINLLQPTQAYQSLLDALRYDPGPLEPAPKLQARKYLQSLKSKLMQVRIVCEQPETEIRLNGRLLIKDQLQYKGVLQEGLHQLVASRPGYQRKSQTLRATPGTSKTVHFKLIPNQKRIKVRYWDNWIPWTVAISGAALLGAGAVLDASAASSFDAYDKAAAEGCTGGCGTDSLSVDVQNKKDSAELERALAITGYAVGGATLVTGIILLIINRERTISVPETAPRKRSALFITPVLGPQHASMQAKVLF